MKTQHSTEFQFAFLASNFRLNLVSYYLSYIVLNDLESTGTTIKIVPCLLYYLSLQTCQRAIV